MNMTAMTQPEQKVDRSNARSAHLSRGTAANPRSDGFTITELLVVVAIIAVILGLVFVAFPKITGGARAARCQANQRAIALAAMSYAADNKTRLVSPRTEQADPSDASDLGYAVFPQAGSYRHYWVAAFNSTQLPGHNGNLVMVDGKRRETVAALRNGALWVYTGNVDIYRSPFDPTPRLRSYSINGFVGVKQHDDADLTSIPAQYKHDTTTLSRIPQPAKTLYTLAEWDRFDLGGDNDFNFNGFMINPDPGSQYWFDIPATWHEDVTISYADGSTGAIQLRNKGLMGADPDGHDFAESGEALDYHDFRKMLLPGLIN